MNFQKNSLSSPKYRDCNESCLRDLRHSARRDVSVRRFAATSSDATCAFAL